MFIKKIFNQKGMSLPEVMIGAALLGGVALVTAKLMDDQANNQAYLRNSAEVASTISKIEMHMNNPDECKQMFFGQPVGTLVPDAPSIMGGAGGTQQTILGFVTATGANVKLLGEFDYGGFEIPVDGFKLQKSIYGGTVTDLIITFNLKGNSVMTRHRSQMIKKIPFVTQLDSSGAIIACGTVLKDAEAVGQQKMCDALGNAAEWNGTKCVLKQVKCPFGQVVTKMTSLGGIVCENIASQVNINELFDVNGVNCIGKPNVQIVNSNGKFKVICN